MDAFDADVLIYAASRGHANRERVARLFRLASTDEPAGVGSVLLLPELLAKPMRTGDDAESTELTTLLNLLELIPVDRELARHATVFAAKYKLKPIDATHLATAVVVGAERLITNNRKDFRKDIDEVEVTYPEELPDVS